MRYEEAVHYIEEVPKFTKKTTLEHTRKILDRLANPQRELRVIHVAGTNGKGSVCAYLNSMLTEGGYVCGLFTSPHLIRINERFMIGGQSGGRRYLSGRPFRRSWRRRGRSWKKSRRAIPPILRFSF